MTIGYGWHTEAEKLAAHHWIELTTISRVLQNFKTRPFSVQSERSAMMTELNNLPRSVPFSTDHRFPDTLMINLDHSVPSHHMRAIVAALDYRDREESKGKHVANEALHERRYSDFNDAKTQFYHAIRHLLDLSAAMAPEQLYIYGIYTRGTFEKQHRLVWSDK